MNWSCSSPIWFTLCAIRTQSHVIVGLANRQPIINSVTLSWNSLNLMVWVEIMVWSAKWMQISDYAIPWRSRTHSRYSNVAFSGVSRDTRSIVSHLVHLLYAQYCAGNFAPECQYIHLTSVWLQFTNDSGIWLGPDKLLETPFSLLVCDLID